jgi:glycosyltransferase involved in cell wall biosynthesis
LEAVEEVLSVSDLFLIPSEKESFGLAALEAIACEVPVISSNTGGLPELMIDGKTGYICDVGDIEGMAAKALHVLKDDNLPTFKQHALQRALEFDVENVLPQYEAFYNKVLEATNKPVG